ncbi:transcriptional regulator [Spiroplasma sp. NBRC 100390]|uniref:MurR/RpiR family transcriptional regulator n=1 Tax=unclassified Spiroplasma TaxID=2637901 RepID=UPI0008928259|nr:MULTISPECIES: MurR/RpiR family transcriptional regulator [unclassified Spiroplasma]AOX43584.1 transcriptional regulator [Spiroplasma sp. TU-14]APE13054.1 transcriptional regulator [Spiroplasma sp. NBRC 100390]
MENISILSKLSMIQGSCTKKEVRIANYIRDNVRNLRNIKIEELSKATGIGYSPIYSLIDKLGFKGYRDFIIAIVAEQERLETNNLNLDATENIFLYYQDILQRNNQIFHSDKLLETVTLLKKAKAIYLVGVGNTGLAVKELANRLFSFGFACSILVEDENNTIMRASLMQPDDLLICMSLEGKTQAVVAAAKEAKNNGANVVAVTSKYNSDLSKYADVNHIVVSSSLYEKSEIFISVLLPLIYWNDNLIQVLLSMDKERQYLENKVKSNKILKKYR